VDYCEDVNKHLGFVKYVKYVEFLGTCCLLKKEFAVRNWFDGNAFFSRVLVAYEFLSVPGFRF